MSQSTSGRFDIGRFDEALFDTLGFTETIQSNEEYTESAEFFLDFQENLNASEQINNSITIIFSEAISSEENIVKNIEVTYQEQIGTQDIYQESAEFFLDFEEHLKLVETQPSKRSGLFDVGLFDVASFDTIEDPVPLFTLEVGIPFTEQLNGLDELQPFNIKAVFEEQLNGFDELGLNTKITFLETVGVIEDFNLHFFVEFKETIGLQEKFFAVLSARVNYPTTINIMGFERKIEYESFQKNIDLGFD